MFDIIMILFFVACTGYSFLSFVRSCLRIRKSNKMIKLINMNFALNQMGLKETKLMKSWALEKFLEGEHSRHR